MERAIDPVFPDCVLQTREARRIAARSEADDFAIVIALPKSGSAALSGVVASLLSQNGVAPFVPVEASLQGGMNRSLSITSSLLRDERSIGAWQVHPPFSQTSVELLRFYRVPSVFLARHPLDHLVALACHWRKPRFRTVLARYEQAGRRHVHSALGMLSIDALRKTPRDAVEDMVRGGYLRQVLWWLENWLTELPQLRCVSLRLEQLNAKPQTVVSDIGKMLRADVEKMQTATDLWVQKLEMRRVAEGNEIYPSGWTGSDRLWRSYCSKREIDLFNQAVQNFISASDRPRVLLDFFPDLVAE